MEYVETLYEVLAVLYLLEAVVWVRRGAVLFVSHCGERHRLQDATSRAWLRNDAGGFLLGNLSPFGSAAQCQTWPVSLGPEGVYATSRRPSLRKVGPAQSGRFVLWSELRDVSRDGRRIAGQRLAVHRSLFRRTRHPRRRRLARPGGDGRCRPPPPRSSVSSPKSSTRR